MKKSIINTLSLLFLCGGLIGCTNGGSSDPTPTPNPDDLVSMAITDETHINYLGRRKFVDDALYIEYSASGFELNVNVSNLANEIRITLNSYVVSNWNNQYAIVEIDGYHANKVTFERGLNTSIQLIQNIPTGNHVISFKKCNEAQFSNMTIYNLEYSGLTIKTYHDERPLIEIYGDSITCGYGNIANSNQDTFLMESEDASLSYANMVGEILNYRTNLISYSGIGLARSIGGGTTTMMEKYELLGGQYYEMQQDVRDYIVFNLGTNDTAVIRDLQGIERDQVLETYYLNFTSLIGLFREYHDETKFIICYNMMIDFDPGFIEIINTLTEDYPGQVFAKEFSKNIQGADGHPDWRAHVANAVELANFISNIEN